MTTSGITSIKSFGADRTKGIRRRAEFKRRELGMASKAEIQDAKDVC
jgi:hypothetical protein